MTPKSTFNSKLKQANLDMFPQNRSIDAPFADFHPSVFHHFVTTDKVGIFSVSQMSETLAALVRYVRAKIRHAHKTWQVRGEAHVTYNCVKFSWKALFSFDSYISPIHVQF